MIYKLNDALKNIIGTIMSLEMLIFFIILGITMYMGLTVTSAVMTQQMSNTTINVTLANLR